MNQVVICECGHANLLEGLRGMPFKNIAGHIVEQKPVDLETGILVLECEACKVHIVWDCATKTRVTA